MGLILGQESRLFIPHSNCINPSADPQEQKPTAPISFVYHPTLRCRRFWDAL